MDEFEFINSIKNKTYMQPSLQKGIGDDAAVFRIPSEDIVTAVDTFVENIHFSFQTMSSYHIGYRALAANISDMAAMGAMPKYYLVSIIIPKSYDKQLILDVFKGMKVLANEFNMDLIGGDTVAGKQLSISVTIIGTVTTDKARYRHQAKENDIVFVTGYLGDSRAGLEVLLNDYNIEHQDYFIHRHRMPNPRVAFASSLNSIPRVALNDVSDGIANELNEIADASNVDIYIDEDRVPIHPNLKQFSSSEQFQWKLFGGEDFELIGSVPLTDWDIVQKKADELHLKISSIGTVRQLKEKEPKVYINQNGTMKTLLRDGYVHLK